MALPGHYGNMPPRERRPGVYIDAPTTLRTLLDSLRKADPEQEQTLQQTEAALSVCDELFVHLQLHLQKIRMAEAQASVDEAVRSSAEAALQASASGSALAKTPIKHPSFVEDMENLAAASGMSTRSVRVGEPYVHHFDGIPSATMPYPPRYTLASSQSAGELLSNRPGNRSTPKPPHRLNPLGSVDELDLEQTSEIRPQDRRRLRRRDLDQKRDRTRSSVLSMSSSVGSFAGGELPIVLPGKMQWVRGQHIKNDTAAKMNGSATQNDHEVLDPTLGAISQLPSELYFGKYQEHLGESSVADIVKAEENLGPLASDGYYSHTTMKARIGKERRQERTWSLQSFDRIDRHRHY